jgi:hypothetical protein
MLFSYCMECTSAYCTYVAQSNLEWQLDVGGAGDAETDGVMRRRPCRRIKPDHANATLPLLPA